MDGTDHERQRVLDEEAGWRHWGPYLSERAWGTVREDYSEAGEAWSYFPHDHARSRAYRWSEDGLGGVCDVRQHLCFAFAFWNGRDPILKERIFGLTGNEGNHGEDAKEYWWYLDSTPTHSFMRWRWLYPQAEFPYADLVAENRRRGRLDPEYELVDTGLLDDDRYFDVEVTYAKAGPDDLCVVAAVRNAGPDEATLDVLPTLWFRNTWSWGLTGSSDEGRKPLITAKDGRLVAEHHALGRMTLVADGTPTPLCCENETNAGRLWDAPASTPYPKDGIGDHVRLEYPTGSGVERTLDEVADDVAGRLVSIFLDDADGRRPVFGGYEKFQTDPVLHGLIPFHEYFHGDTGMGLGASHQTGWTGLVADLIISRQDRERP